MASSHRVTDLEKIPVRISKDEAPTPLSVVGPLFISSLLFHLSRILLGAWRFSLFRSVYSSFHNRLTSSGSLPFIECFILFSQFILVCFIICKNNKFCSFQFNRLAISWPPWVRVWSWASYRFLPFTVFSLLACPFVSRVISFIYDVQVRGVVSKFNESSHSFFVWGSS